MKHYLLSAATACLFLCNLSAQSITNDVTLSITYAYEATGYQRGNLIIQPSPVVRTYNTGDLIAQMAKCRNQIIARGAKLQITIDTNDNVLPQVKNSNSTVVDVSDLLTLSPGTNGLNSGTFNISTSSSSITNLDKFQMTYSDTSYNTSNGISFSFQALSSFSVLLTPTKTSNIYAVKNNISITGGVGDGHVLDTNGGTNFFIIKNAVMNSSGSGTLSLSFN